MNEQTLYRVEECTAKQRELAHKLKRSYSLQKLWPQAFVAGPVTSYITGNLSDWQSIRFMLKRKDDVIKLFTLDEVIEHDPSLLRGFVADNFNVLARYNANRMRQLGRVFGLTGRAHLLALKDAVRKYRETGDVK